MKAILLSLFIFNFCACLSQFDTIKNGAYRNCLEFRNNDPSYECEFIMRPKVNHRVPNLYSIKSVNDSIKGRIVRKAIWGIYCDGTFYLNLRRIGMTRGYVALWEMEKFSYFKGKAMYSMYQKKKLYRSQLSFGLIGLAVTDTKIKNEIRDNNNYILNFETGQVNLITPNYVHRILSDYPALQAVFELEEDKSNSQLRRYIQLVNEGDKLKMESLLNTP